MYLVSSDSKFSVDEATDTPPQPHTPKGKPQKKESRSEEERLNIITFNYYFWRKMRITILIELILSLCEAADIALDKCLFIVATVSRNI